MPSTPEGFRYPLSSDSVDIPRDIEYLARDVASGLLPATHFGAAGSVLDNVSARVHPAEQICKQAVLWLDAAHSSASGQTITNLGWGGSALNAQAGSTAGADSNDPKFLAWSGENYVYLPGVVGNWMTVPDSAPLNLTGDIDLRFRARDWVGTTAVTGLVMKYSSNTGLSTNAYGLRASDANRITLVWRDSGGTAREASTSTSLPASAAWIEIRGTLEVATGQMRGYYRTDPADAWTELTAPAAIGATSINAGTCQVGIGATEAGSAFPFEGKVLGASILSGINGTPVLDIDTSLVASGAATSFTARTGQTVTINRSTSGRKAVAVCHPVWLLGTDDYLSVADSPLTDFTATDSFAAVVVARRWGTPSGDQRLLMKWDSSGYYLTMDAGGSITTTITGTVGTTTGANAFTSGALFTAAAVRNVGADTIATALNGVTASTTDLTTTTLENAGPLTIGRQEVGTTAHADAEFYAVAVFRRALTSDEITTLTNYYTARVGA